MPTQNLYPLLYFLTVPVLKLTVYHVDRIANLYIVVLKGKYRTLVVSEYLSIHFCSVHGSSVSLVSTASSLYSTPEEKQSHEIRKLRRELQDAQEKVHTLTNQLSTNVCLHICSNNLLEVCCNFCLMSVHWRYS